MIVVERIVDVGTDDMWQLLSDLQRWDRMLPTVQRVSRLGVGGPVGEGARFEVHQPGLPKAVYEITEWNPGHGFSWEASSPGVRTTASHEVRARANGTQLVLGIAWTGPLARVARVVLESKVRRMVEQEADAFVRLAASHDHVE